MIEIKDLKMKYSYGEEFAIPSLTFNEGEISSVIGKNGSGKTTLLRTIAGILPYTGHLLIDNKESREYKNIERAKVVAYLPQMIKAVSLDVETLVAHGRFSHLGNYRRMNEKDRTAIENALKITKMTDYRNRYLTELSGGELRRAYLAMVIAQGSKIILLDEPTSYMDIENQRLFYEILKELAASGCGIVQICHDIEQSFTYSDKLILMRERTVIANGTPEELLAKEELIRDTFGVYVMKTVDKSLLYPYVLTK